MSLLRLYAHALVLVGWAVAIPALQIPVSTNRTVVFCVTLAASSVVAELERSRRRRDRR